MTLSLMTTLEVTAQDERTVLAKWRVGAWNNSHKAGDLETAVTFPHYQ